jgi:hypothetical protein
MIGTRVPSPASPIRKYYLEGCKARADMIDKSDTPQNILISKSLTSACNWLNWSRFWGLVDSYWPRSKIMRTLTSREMATFKALKIGFEVKVYIESEHLQWPAALGVAVPLPQCRC